MYLDKLVPIFVQLISGTKQRDILIINSLPNKQYGFVKSNYIVSYIAKGLALKHRVDFKNKKIRVIDSVKNLLKYKDLSKSTLVFVDDFIGTGKTTINAILYIQHRLQANGKAEPQYSVLSIAAMEQGIQEIKRLDIPVFNSVTLKRGISDYYFGEELESKKELMKSISIKLKKVNNSFLMGYDSSEALICMERCPNNTFPVFWMGRNIAPYER
jgi:phosphoribosylpyrophosphate synthetase